MFGVYYQKVAKRAPGRVTAGSTMKAVGEKHEHHFVAKRKL